MTFEGQSRVVLTRQTMLFGADAASDRLADEVASQGWRRVAVFASPSVTKSGLLDEVVQRALGGCEVVATFDAIAGHAPIDDTETFAHELAGVELDALV